MPKTRVSCPNCRQPVVAEIDQLFDVNQDPTAKQRLLSGAFNLIQCPTCGYQGNLATPILYHDPEKELLLTFVPAELGLPQAEQERLIGSLINQVISKLPQEKRKAYLFQPQPNLTMQGLIERVLQEDGITREMIQAQQQRLNLIQRLASTSDESVRAEIARQEDALIDAEFFALLSRLTEAAMMSGDRESAQALADLQNSILPVTTFGQQVQAQSKEVEAAIAELRQLGREVTREKVLELVINAPNDTRVRAYVSLARPVMDYTFFQLFSERIDRARGDGRNRLVELRTLLLELTQEIDRQVEAHVQQTRQLVDAVLQSPDVSEAMQQAMPAVDEYFVREVSQRLQDARAKGDLEASSKLQAIVDVIQQASAPPPEMALVEQYLDLEDDPARKQFLLDHQDEITPEFVDLFSNILAQVQSGDDAELREHIQAANRQMLRFSMERNLRS
jgi:hypothetical protein